MQAGKIEGHATCLSSDGPVTRRSSGLLHAACGPSASAPVALASGIDLGAADGMVRVQDDLFRHVNGTWLAKTDIPADRSSWGSFDRLVEKSQEDLRAIAEDAAKAGNKSPGATPRRLATSTTAS